MTDLNNTEFDYLVIGGGSAGAAVASRLSEDPAVQVALVEAGPDDRGNDVILRLDRWMELLESGYDWDYPIEEQENGNSFMRHARAKVMGGCSSHNSCIAFWAPREDIDEWEQKFGAAGWNAEMAYRLYKKLETNEDAGAEGQHHGDSGPVHLMNVPPSDPSGKALLAACEKSGLPQVRFNSGETVINGANFFQINRQADGTRASSSVSYIHPIMDRKNFTLLTDLRARKLNFDADNRCTGVDVVDNSFGKTQTLTARAEVILSAGAIDSPKLLMLSGIGPAAQLEEFGIEVRVDSPGVGEHLQDHPEGVIQWEAKQPMPETSTQWWEIGIFAATEEGLDRPDLMFHYGSVPFDMHTLRQGFPTTENGFCLTPNVTHARSRGTVKLRSSDYRDKPRVDPRYFTDPHDMRVMVAGIRKAREIVALPEMAEWAGRELYPGEAIQSDAEITDYIRKTHNTVYHPAGTVRMGAVDDVLSPLDPELRVKGVTGLRVADASVMPELTTVNPNITTMMIGERCAELVKEARLA
ncbi:GMC family oxidoreductase N-terminal domain-containing protein [Arthrobacter sp. AL08]|uniref:GMC family oxidoreductase n=1 Tax=unclassified Arthrobacter TaxID=235627 RepID=UPI00249B4D61|nr:MULTISPECIES: GMC oxidoreductase [unclassified Arthrobacter]MDI3240276.1 GMC family oxidoreductase N-terminal domain-containing protein [Arthrobacter sp. AL05]MDI3276286.1 GMC family oxidoreductase N-terminal domain-containing protein [Arthrobacter sp. AL08]